MEQGQEGVGPTRSHGMGFSSWGSHLDLGAFESPLPQPEPLPSTARTAGLELAHWASPGIGSEFSGFVPVKACSLRIYSTKRFFFKWPIFLTTIFETFSVVVKQLFKWCCTYFGDLIGEERSWQLNLQDLLLKCENNSFKAAASVSLCDAVHKEGLISFPGVSQCSVQAGGMGSREQTQGTSSLMRDA